MDLKIIVNDKNYTVINFKSKLFCFSYLKVIAVYDINKNTLLTNKNLDMTETNKKHLGLFKKLLTNMYL